MPFWPEILNEEVFIEGFRKAEIANYDAKERDQYEESLKYYRDLKAVIDTAVNEALDKGEKKKALEIAKKCIQKGMPLKEVSDLTGFSIEEIQKLNQ